MATKATKELIEKLTYPEADGPKSIEEFVASEVVRRIKSKQEKKFKRWLARFLNEARKQ